MSLLATTYDSLCKALIKALRAESGLPAEYILNSDSLRGPDIFKTMCSSVVKAPTIDDTFIIFELVETDNGVGATYKNNTTMEVLATFQLHLKIYGRGCHDMSHKLLAHFKNPDIAIGLIEAGAHISGISSITGINEFINNTLWPRNDITLNVDARFVYATTGADDTVSFTYPIHITNI